MLRRGWIPFLRNSTKKSTNKWNNLESNKNKEQFFVYVKFFVFNEFQSICINNCCCCCLLLLSATSVSKRHYVDGVIKNLYRIADSAVSLINASSSGYSKTSFFIGFVRLADCVLFNKLYHLLFVHTTRRTKTYQNWGQQQKITMDSIQLTIRKLYKHGFLFISSVVLLFSYMY